MLLTRLREAQAAYDQSAPERGGWKVDSATVKASIAGVGGEAQLRRTDAAPASPDDLAAAVEAAVAAAGRVEAGLLITLDEAHLARKDELATLAALLQHAAGQRWPLVAVLAGLPSMQDPKRMVTYLERAEWHSLRLLSDADTRHALTGPADEVGRAMTEAAADLLVAASGGYPYAIQVLGHHTWRASHGNDRITVEHARAGAQAAARDLADGLFSARWNDASDREQDYLVALASLLVRGEQPIGADVARELGAAPEAVTYLRARLLSKGTVYLDGRVMRFEVPGMAEWILNNADSRPST